MFYPNRVRNQSRQGIVANTHPILVLDDEQLELLTRLRIGRTRGAQAPHSSESLHELEQRMHSLMCHILALQAEEDGACIMEEEIWSHLA
ncbi:hypothetical protein N7453_002353 [Penicillium expansum]|nr:hypothetical protein N7453_002353 [Penicillium expansum]